MTILFNCYSYKIIKNVLFFNQHLILKSIYQYTTRFLKIINIQKNKHIMLKKKLIIK